MGLECCCVIHSWGWVVAATKENAAHKSDTTVLWPLTPACRLSWLRPTRAMPWSPPCHQRRCSRWRRSSRTSKEPRAAGHLTVECVQQHCSDGSCAWASFVTLQCAEGGGIDPSAQRATSSLLQQAVWLPASASRQLVSQALVDLRVGWVVSMSDTPPMCARHVICCVISLNCLLCYGV